MIFSIAVLSAPSDSGAPARALAFVAAALDAGHSIERVFFYGAGVRCTQILASKTPPPGGATDWIALAQRANFELSVCSKSAQQHACTELMPHFLLCGLGDLLAATLMADRNLMFAD